MQRVRGESKEADSASNMSEYSTSGARTASVRVRDARRVEAQSAWYAIGAALYRWKFARVETFCAKPVQLKGWSVV